MAARPPPQVRCPYCFDQFGHADALLRCSGLVSRGHGETDPVFEAKWGTPGSPGLRPPLLGTLPPGTPCPGCNARASVRVCPQCHHDLPPAVFDTAVDCKVISVIGGRYVGKSTYLASLLHELEARAYDQLGIRVRREDEHTRGFFTHNYERPLFSERRTLTFTAHAARNPEPRLPFTFTLELPHRNPSGAPKIRSVLLIFYDSPGEQLGDVEQMRNFTRSVAHADGLLYLVDPLQLRHVQADRLARGLTVPKDNDGDHVLSRAVTVIRERLGVASTALPVHVALALTKQDTIRDLLHDQSPLRRPADYRGGFDIAEARHVSEDMESWLRKVQPTLVGQVEGFARRGFFAVSALGCQPGPKGELAFVEPFRVLDPLLWLLHTLGYLSAAE